MDQQIKPGDTVKFRRAVDPGDDKLLMKVLEIHPPGKWISKPCALVETLLDMPINPTNSVPLDDLKIVPQKLAAKWVSENCRFAKR